MKMMGNIKIILLFILFASVGFAYEPSPSLNIKNNFSFTALSGHKINYSIANDTLSILTSNGVTLASGKPSHMRLALPREGFFQHSFSIYSIFEGTTFEYTMIFRTKLEFPQAAKGVTEPGNDYVDTKILVSTGFWITDQTTQSEILTSSLSEGSEEIGKVISIN